MLVEFLEKKPPTLELNFDEEEVSFELPVSVLLIVDVGEGDLSVDSSPFSPLGPGRPRAEERPNMFVVRFFFVAVLGVGNGSDREVFLSIR